MDMADRMLRQARQRVDSTARALDAAVRERRAALARLEGADGADRAALELRLEEARLAALVAEQRREAARVQQQLAAKEEALREAQRALFGAKLRLVRPYLVYPREALEEGLNEVDSREQALLAEIETLTRAGDAVEAERFRARLRLQRAEPGSNTAPLEAWLKAREDQLAAARLEHKTSRVIVAALIRDTSQWFVLIVAIHFAMAVSGLAQGKVQHWLEMLLVVALYPQIGLRANA